MVGFALEIENTLPKTRSDAFPLRVLRRADFALVYAAVCRRRAVGPDERALRIA